MLLSHETNKKKNCWSVTIRVIERKPENIDSEETLSFIKDILRYLDDNDSEE